MRIEPVRGGAGRHGHLLYFPARGEDFGHEGTVAQLLVLAAAVTVTARGGHVNLQALSDVPVFFLVQCSSQVPGYSGIIPA